jgi:hypothetical protein
MVKTSGFSNRQNPFPLNLRLCLSRSCEERKQNKKSGRAAEQKFHLDTPNGNHNADEILVVWKVKRKRFGSQWPEQAHSDEITFES